MSGSASRSRVFSATFRVLRFTAPVEGSSPNVGASFTSLTVTVTSCVADAPDGSVAFTSTVYLCSPSVSSVVPVSPSSSESSFAAVFNWPDLLSMVKLKSALA